MATLEAEIKKVDQQYDLCNEAWAKGEADRFATDEFLDQNVCLLKRTPSPLRVLPIIHSVFLATRFVKDAESKMKAATFVFHS